MVLSDRTIVVRVDRGRGRGVPRLNDGAVVGDTDDILIAFDLVVGAYGARGVCPGHDDRHDRFCD